MKRILMTGVLSVIGGGYLLTRTLPVPVGEGPAYTQLPKVPYDQHPNKHFISQVPKSIGIIGAGASGLVTAKVLKQQGYTVELLEKRENYGGVWFNNYEGAGLQGAFYTYNMPDFCFPNDTPLIPKQDVILKFLDGYVERFGLRDLIKFNSTVKEVIQVPDGTWEVVLSDGSKKSYDFLVLSTGAFHTPYIPSLPGLSSFPGKVLHSSELLNAKAICEGKKVLVIGGRKSAFDMLQVAANYTTQVTGLMRKIHWSVPTDFNLAGLHAGHLLFSRTTMKLFIFSQDDSEWLALFLKPLSTIYWSILSHKLKSDLPATAHPTVTLKSDRQQQLMSRDKDFEAKLQSGKITMIEGTAQRVVPEGVITEAGKLIEADVIILATGFKQHFFGIKEEEDGQWRYRNTLVPGIKNFAAVGISSTGFSMLYVNLQAVWLTEVLRGKVKLPSPEAMEEDTNARKAFIRKMLPSQDRSFYWLEQDLIDAMMRDMGLQVRREKNWLNYFFLNVNVTDYEAVITHRV